MRSLGDIAGFLDARLVGDADLQVADAKTILRANNDEITFACSEKHLELYLQSACLAAVVPHDLKLPTSSETNKSFIIVDNVENSFAKIVVQFRSLEERKRIGISDQAFISDSANIAEDVDIYPGAYIGDNVLVGCGSVIHPNVTILENTEIGANTTVFPNVVLYENTVVGDRCLIHGGAVIGAYGFGYKSSDRHQLSHQLGNVVIGSDVEIGSNTTIDRGTYDSTTIGNGSKLDDLVMIGHNCQIGQHNLLCSQVGIAGSSTTGDFVVMAGQVGIGDHLEIENKVTIAAKSGVMHNLAANQVYLGAPAKPVREQMQIHAIVGKLPEMRKQIKNLQRMVDQLMSARTNDISNEAA